MSALVAGLFGLLTGTQIHAEAIQANALTADRILRFADEVKANSHAELEWSPDGQQLAVLASNGTNDTLGGKLWLINAKDGRQRTLLSTSELTAVQTAHERRPGAAPSESPASNRPLRFSWAPDGKALLFAGTHWLAWFDLAGRTSRTLVDGKEPLIDPKISPSGSAVSFIRNHRLWLVNIHSSKTSPLTSSSPGEHSQGELDPVYAQGLGLKTGYWWSPDGSALAYLESAPRPRSERPTLNTLLGESGEDPSEAPLRAGEPVPAVRLMVAAVSSTGTDPRLLDSANEGSVYLPRATWLPGGAALAVEHLNRAQTQLDLLEVDARSGASHVLLTEKDLYWINLNDGPCLLHDGRFIWSSERSGYRHLYLYGRDGTLLRQLTNGKWEASEIAGVNEASQTVYLIASEKSALERQLYRIHLDGSGFGRITGAAGWHRVKLAPGNNYFLDTFSDVSTPPREDLVRINGALVQHVLSPPEADHLVTSPNEFVSFQTHEDTVLQGSLIKPADFDPKRKYPVIIFAGGGPGEQVVKNAWGGSTFLWHEMMAQKGFVIFLFDPRGSGGYGHLFEEPIHYWLGSQEGADDRDAVSYLRKFPFVDASRIGIWGKQYGGQLAIHALTHDPEDFHAAYAEAPITNWVNYNPLFTERYLGAFDKHHEEYRQSSPIEDAARMRGKLFMAVPVERDLVFLANALALQGILSKAGNPPEIELLSGLSEDEKEQSALKCLVTRGTEFFRHALRAEP